MRPASGKRKRAACHGVRVTVGHSLTRRAGIASGHSRAFTLIEMIVALVLASLMMVGLLGIVLSVSKQSGQLRRDQTDHVAAGLLADRLRNDLINARGIAAGSDTLILSGYVVPQNVPGMIRYERAMIGSRRLLIRRVGQNREVCWVDFGAFEFEAYDEFDPEAPVPEMTGGLLPMPARFRIAGRDSEGRLLFDEVIDHHEL
ncbi:PulJ/GspJ family protein [Rhodopirellula sp. JC639]|uniref:PulJ/GspJ family protein n=1 Tax=Stieleria mannarensis TaxID=2755585 RepID=UPI002570EA03|nr:prepilin-type N-terminal cleavage/methylation domain-containing protein [Rhodopirellula sp. JC639]